MNRQTNAPDGGVGAAEANWALAKWAQLQAAASTATAPWDRWPPPAYVASGDQLNRHLPTPAPSGLASWISNLHSRSGCLFPHSRLNLQPGRTVGCASNRSGVCRHHPPVVTCEDSKDSHVCLDVFVRRPRKRISGPATSSPGECASRWGGRSQL